MAQQQKPEQGQQGKAADQRHRVETQQNPTNREGQPGKENPADDERDRVKPATKS